MILTCPECATSYFVDDARVPAEGRRVKCTACGARWTARREDEPQDDLFDGAEVASSPQPEPPVLAEPEVVVAEPVDDLDVSGPEPDGLRRRPAAAAAARKKSPAKSEARGAALLWGGLAAVAALAVAGAVVFREELVSLWPQSSGAFAAVGLGVAGGGLVIENVAAKATSVGGRPALEVSGAIRNARGAENITPPIRVSLLDRDGKPLTAKIVRAADPKIPGKATRYFTLAIENPPANASDLEVTFQRRAAKPEAVADHAAEAEASPEHAPAGHEPPSSGSHDAPTHG